MSIRSAANFVTSTLSVLATGPLANGVGNPALAWVVAAIISLQVVAIRLAVPT